jgi:hypothetical protein
VARSHALVHCSILDSSLSHRSIPAQLLYRQLLERRERSTLGVIVYRPGSWAKTLPGLTAVDVEHLVDELEEHGHLIVDRDTLEVVHRTHMHHDGVLKQAQVIMAAAKARPTVESPKIGAAIDAQIPPALRDRWPEGIANGKRGEVQAWLHEVDAASYKPPRKPDGSPPTSPPQGSPTSPTEAQGQPSTSPTLGQRQALVTGDRCPVSGDSRQPVEKHPPPHAERGEPSKPQPTTNDHHGQHPNCRRCGTNPRAQGTNPRGPKPPTPEEATVAALGAEIARNAARATGGACPTCDGALWLDPELLEDRSWGAARPCPDCNPEARSA